MTCDKSLTETFRYIYYNRALGNDITDFMNKIRDSELSEKTKKELNDAYNFYENYNKNGIVVLKNIYPREKVIESVNEIWSYILSLPYKEEIKEKLQKVWKELKDDPWKPPTKQQIEIIKKHYPMTGGFGALTMAPAFHLKTQWDARQDPVIVEVFRKILGEKNIKAYFDRASFKMPGQGETEFTHWDSNPFSWEKENREGVQGILSFSDTSFRAVPKTHTDKFRKKFIKIYPEGKRHDQYHITSKIDPMELRNKVQVYPLHPGDFVIWSNRLLHEARKNTTDKIRYAYFINFYPNDNPNPNMLKSYQNAKINYDQERLESFENGTNPSFFPSGTAIRLFSKSHLMFHPNVLNNFCSQFTTGCEDYTYKSGKKEGMTIQVPIEWNPMKLGIYTRPKLTELGETLI